MKADYLIYFCPGIDSVFDSQVLELVKSISCQKVFKKVYLFMGIKNDTEKEQFSKRTIPPDIEVVQFRLFPNYPLFNSKIRKELLNKLQEKNLVTDKAIYHTRHEILAWHLSKILNKNLHNRILPDVRGATIEEITEYSGINPILKQLKIFNYKRALNNLRKFKKINAVTDTLKEYLTDNFRVYQENISIIPCLAGKQFKFDLITRNKIRTSLNLATDDILLLYAAGGTDKWHDTDVVTALANKGMKLLNLSKKTIEHENVINKFVNYSEMPDYLNAVDASILWRNKSTVNEVASPVKFSEYICCGLPVIANYSVNLISEYILNSKHGFLSENEELIDLERMKKLKSLNRFDISAKGMEHFGIDSITNKYLKLYLSM